METSFNQTVAVGYAEKPQKGSLVKRFLNWSEGQQKNNLLWLGVTLSAHGCIITPVTVLILLATGMNMFLFMLALVAMGATLVTSLAAMPTKITIPVFILSTLVDIAIIFSSVFMGLATA